jgi:murein peptide amidase A
MSLNRWSGNRGAAKIVVVLAAVAVLVLLAADRAGSATHRLPPARLLALSAVAHPRTAQRLQRFRIGRSVQGRQIDAVELAGPAALTSVLVVGCIHGNEPAGIAIARRLLAARPPPRSALWIVPDLNPDGVAGNTRQNADGVDLNRNFPWHWQALGVRGDLQYSGPRPLSEPESQAARALILRARPRITIWFHQPEGLVDLSGGDPRVERRFARLVGLSVQRLTRYPGSAVSWENSVVPGATAFVVELPPGSLSKAATARYAHAVLMLANHWSP